MLPHPDVETVIFKRFVSKKIWCRTNMTFQHLCLEGDVCKFYNMEGNKKQRKDSHYQKISVKSDTQCSFRLILMN